VTSPPSSGLDLVGASPDYATGRKVAKAYFDTVDERLQKQFNVKLLGVWPVRPADPVLQEADHQAGRHQGHEGARVRPEPGQVHRAGRRHAGAVSFADTHQSLSLGVVDCAITGPSSANSAGWPEVTTHQMPLGFQMALNGYAITLKAWNQLKPDQQAKLKAAFDSLTDEIWKYSEELFQDALNCNAGKDPCTTGQEVQAGQRSGHAGDLELVRAPVTKVSLPAGPRSATSPTRAARRSGRRRSRRCWG
jgi:hypothetical protein